MTEKTTSVNRATVLLRGLMKRCPACGGGGLYRGWVNIEDRCPHCGITLQPYSGDALGVYAVAYVLTLVPALATLVLAWSFLKLAPMQLVLLFAVVDGALLFALFPTFKTLWISMVYLATGLRPRL